MIKSHKDIINLISLMMISFAIKILLIPAYFSTDFDVHQNWLRITNTKDMSQWYFDNQSKWTLDYPPFFAYFQFFLAKMANIYDPEIANSINKHANTVLFQRISVIISQIPLLLTLYYVIGQINYKLIISYLFIPFIILDNIHFQYNIVMQAIFILSVYLISKQKYLQGAFTYSCLLNFKHIYLYASIAFASYLLKHYVLKPNDFQSKVKNLIRLASITILPFVMSFLPFVIAGGFNQIKQIFSRLFPFQRGLIHIYWAPNIWALYYFLDKVLNIFWSKFFKMNVISFKEVNGQLHQLKLLPQITPLITTIFILVATVPIIIKFINCNVKFYKLIFICGTIFFMFGFHVHEKAITPYISLLFIFLQVKQDSSVNCYLHQAIFVNIINLIPLLVDDNEKILKLFLPLLWIAIWDYRKPINTILQVLIISVGIFIIFYHELMHPFLKSNNLQFLPLMLNSVFSASFNICWISIIYYKQIISKQYLRDKINEYQKISMLQQ